LTLGSAAATGAAKDAGGPAGSSHVNRSTPPATGIAHGSSYRPEPVIEGVEISPPNKAGSRASARGKNGAPSSERSRAMWPSHARSAPKGSVRNPAPNNGQ